jgi:hypothetical protein
MVQAATHATIHAMQTRFAAGETTAIKEYSGAGRTCAEVRTAAKSELRVWQDDDGEGGEARLRRRWPRGAGLDPLQQADCRLYVVDGVGGERSAQARFQVTGSLGLHTLLDTYKINTI